MAQQAQSSLKNKLFALRFTFFFIALLWVSTPLLATINTFSRNPSALNDASFWQNIYLEKKIAKHTFFRINEEGRLTNNFSRPGFVYLDAGINYKLSKFIHLSLAYVANEKKQKTDFWSMRHQVYMSCTLKKSIKDFTFDYRTMIQWQVKDVRSSSSGKIPQYYLRGKTTIKYERHFKFQPYIANELYYFLTQLDARPAYHFNRSRYFAGLYYHPDKVNELEFYYLFENNFNLTKGSSSTTPINPQNNWIIGIGYARSL